MALSSRCQVQELGGSVITPQKIAKAARNKTGSADACGLLRLPLHRLLIRYHKGFGVDRAGQRDFLRSGPIKINTLLSMFVPVNGAIARSRIKSEERRVGKRRIR